MTVFDTGSMKPRPTISFDIGVRMRDGSIEVFVFNIPSDPRGGVAKLVDLFLERFTFDMLSDDGATVLSVSGEAIPEGIRRLAFERLAEQRSGIALPAEHRDNTLGCLLFGVSELSAHQRLALSARLSRIPDRGRLRPRVRAI